MSFDVFYNLKKFQYNTSLCENALPSEYKGKKIVIFEYIENKQYFKGIGVVKKQLNDNLFIVEYENKTEIVKKDRFCLLENFKFDKKKSIDFIINEEQKFELKKSKKIFEDNIPNIKSFIKTQNLSECVGLVKKVNQDIVLGINRDKIIYPWYEIQRKLIVGVEVILVIDKKTDWIQGLNEFGITLINTNYTDENSKTFSKTDKILDILAMSNIDSVLHYFKNEENRIPGLSFLTDGKKAFLIEVTLKDKIMLVKEIDYKGEVITNHGINFKKEGFQQKENPEQYLSSTIRKKDAEKLLLKSDNLFDVLSNQKYEVNNPNNILRNTKKAFTNCSIVINATQKLIEVQFYMNKIESFEGIKNELPKNYVPKIKLKVKKVFNRS